MIQFKNLEKQEQTKTKSNMIKIRARINEIGSRKIQSKSWFFEKIRLKVFWPN